MSDRHYHNAEGWLRDILAARDEYERDPGGRGSTVWLKLVELVDDAMACADEAADNAIDTTDGGATDVDSDEPEEREADAPRARRHAARREALSLTSSGLGRELARLPGRQRGQAQPDELELRARALGAPGVGLKPTRVESVPVKLALNPPKAAPRPARKGVSRGKKRTTRKTKR